MADADIVTSIRQLLLKCLVQQDPMLEMLEWLCKELMEVEISNQAGAVKYIHSSSRSDYRCGYRPARLHTRMGTMYLIVPRIRNSGYIPFFVKHRKTSEEALIGTVCDCFVNGVSTQRIDSLAHILGIENISPSQVSKITKGLDKQANEFQNRSLADSSYPVLWVDSLYEKITLGGHIKYMAIMVVGGVSSEGKREILSIMPRHSESKEYYYQLFKQLIERGLKSPALVVSDANEGLVTAIGDSFPGASWLRCKVHIMRDILVHVKQREKPHFSARLQEIWSAPNVVIARQRAKELIELYNKRFPKAIQILEDILDDALVVFYFPGP